MKIESIQTIHSVDNLTGTKVSYENSGTITQSRKVSKTVITRWKTVKEIIASLSHYYQFCFSKYKKKESSIEFCFLSIEYKPVRQQMVPWPIWQPKLHYRDSSLRSRKQFAPIDLSVRNLPWGGSAECL